MPSLDAVAKREERVGSEGCSGDPGKVCFFLLSGQRLRLLTEVFLPVALCTDILFVFIDITVDGVVTDRTGQVFLEREVQDLLMHPQMPCVRLACRQSGAVDTGLLSGTYADALSVHSEADGVGLGIFQCDQSDDQVDLRIFRDLLVLGHYVFEQAFIDFNVIVPLLEGDAEHLPALLFLRLILRVDGDDVVAALLLSLQDLQGFVRVTRGDDAIRDLSLDDVRRRRIAHIRQSDEITEGAQTVRTTGTGISTGQRRVIQAFDVVYEIGFFHLLRQLRAHRR